MPVSLDTWFLAVVAESTWYAPGAKRSVRKCSLEMAISKFGRSAVETGKCTLFGQTLCCLYFRTISRQFVGMKHVVQRHGVGVHHRVSGAPLKKTLVETTSPIL